LGETLKWKIVLSSDSLVGPCVVKHDWSLREKNEIAEVFDGNFQEKKYFFLGWF
jgi:hypothetical protein